MTEGLQTYWLGPTEGDAPRRRPRQSHRKMPFTTSTTNTNRATDSNGKT
jgi:hypothetical protein